MNSALGGVEAAAADGGGGATCQARLLLIFASPKPETIKLIQLITLLNFIIAQIKIIFFFIFDVFSIC